MLSYNSVKDLRVTEIVEQITFERVLGKIDSKNVFGDNHSQNILEQFQLLSEIVHYRKSLISVFQEIFTGINKTFTLAGRLNNRLLSYEV